MTVRLESEAYLRGLGWLAFAGLLLGVLMPIDLLGWLGVIEMSRGFYGLFGTVVALALGVMALVAGIRQRWGWAELAFGDEAITVTHGIARSVRRTDMISRPPGGVPIGARIEEIPLDRGHVAYFLVVHDGVRPEPIEIGKQLRVGRPRLAEVAAQIEGWAR
jgi:hypothetical protein